MVANNFYGSTQSRLKTYTKDRRVEEHNGDIQQAKVYEKLAEERGDIETANRFAKMAGLVINKFGQSVQEHTVNPNIPITQQPFDIRNYLVSAIQNGTLSQLWNKIKSIPKDKLSKTAQVIQSDIKVNKMLQEEINIKLSEMLKKKKAISDTVGDMTAVVDTVDSMIQLITGSKENEPALTELITKAETSPSTSQYATPRTGLTPSTSQYATPRTGLTPSTSPRIVQSPISATIDITPDDIEAELQIVLNNTKPKNKVRKEAIETLKRYYEYDIQHFLDIFDSNPQLKKMIKHYRGTKGTLYEIKKSILGQH